MNLIHRIGYWGERHHPQWLDIFRIMLGIFLCFKGIQFLNNMGLMIDMMAAKMSFGSFILLLLSHYIIFAHLLGGFLLILGILTRFACLIQIPILVGAIFFFNAQQDLMRPFSALLLSIIVLLLLCYFLIVGNGPWSFEKLMRNEKKQ